MIQPLARGLVRCMNSRRAMHVQGALVLLRITSPLARPHDLRCQAMSFGQSFSALLCQSEMTFSRVKLHSSVATEDFLVDAVYSITDLSRNVKQNSLPRAERRCCLGDDGMGLLQGFTALG
jgi:hypothetical protein